MSGETVLYNQLQPWSQCVGAPCVENSLVSPVPPRTPRKASFQTPKVHPWRPTLGYETTQTVSMPSLPVTNSLVDPVYAPGGMATEPLRFPNLVTGAARNPGHAARAALYTRYTPFDWANNIVSMTNEANTARNFSERLRSESLRVMRQTEERSKTDQQESGRRLGERITDTAFWRNELAAELDEIIKESDLLQDSKRAVEKALSDIEAPLHIAQENLYQREQREGIDLVHDQVEQSLLQEIEAIKSVQCRLKRMIQKLADQLRCNRAAQAEIEMDVKNKENALGIDTVAHQLNNFSRGINYYGGIERYDPTITTLDTWKEFSNRNCERAESERLKSAQIRADADHLLNQTANEIWTAWSATNNAFSRRIAEVLEAKSRLQSQLHKVQNEIFDEEKNIEMIRKAILDKSKFLKVGHTRLEVRTHRKSNELCRDDAQGSLVSEVQDLENSVCQLHRKLEEAEAQHQQLLYTQANLDDDLKSKINSLFIDREKITATVFNQALNNLTFTIAATLLCLEEIGVFKTQGALSKVLKLPKEMGDFTLKASMD